MAEDTVVSGVGIPPKQAANASAQLDTRGPAAAIVVICSFAFLSMVCEPATPDSSMPWTLNPTGLLTPGLSLLVYIATVPAKEVLNVILMFVGEKVMRFQRIDEADGKVRKLEVLEKVDLCYLGMNTVVEFIGMNHIVACLIDSPLEQRLSSFNIFNGPVAFIIVMCLNDIIYYPFHLVAHRRAFYPYCHKQHHRQFVPFRGYADAANQHPLEQIYGFLIFITCLRLTAKVTGVHAATGWVAFLAWATLNIWNHLGFDSSLHLPLPYPAYPRDHQMHHRFPQCNYSTLTSFCDRAFGTFRPYRELGVSMSDAAADSVMPDDGGRPEALPSPMSVACLAVALILAASAVEVVQTGSMPPLHHYLFLLRSVVLLINLAIFVTAIEVAAATPAERPRPKGAPHLVKAFKEAVPPGHVKTFQSPKDVWKNTLQAEPPKPFKRE